MRPPKSQVSSAKALPLLPHLCQTTRTNHGHPSLLRVLPSSTEELTKLSIRGFSQNTSIMVRTFLVGRSSTRSSHGWATLDGPIEKFDKVLSGPRLEVLTWLLLVPPEAKHPCLRPQMAWLLRLQPATMTRPPASNVRWGEVFTLRWPPSSDASS